ncbi:hypothetical protein MN116_001278 [Schistosoma mekongi]|uniref:Ubiquitin-like domain-containing protein n=1 Tax=Schistosoma mekongi TaxID=38744 RepID=A0AAE2DAA5_SCHME|nr:hypothetical protein MN116_001278 [Schistosoma mekongi]
MSNVGFKVIVKSPDDKIPNLTVQCLASWLVKDLKIYLSEHHPAQPNVASQRLIHAGKLLKDDLIISDIVNQANGLQTIHLVCPNPKVTAHTETNHLCDNTWSNISSEQMQKYQQAYYHYLQFFYMENPAINQAEYHSHAYYWPYFFGTGAVMQISPGNTPFSTQTPSSSHQATPSSSSANTHQWIQRTQTFLSSWGVHFGNRRPQEVAEALPNDVGNNQRADQIQPQVAQDVMVVNNPMRNNIRQDDEANGVGNVDIIDRFYMLFRLCLFMGLCFAYSSLDKALIVFSVAAYVYLYNIYRRYAVVERVVQVQQGPQDEQGNSNQPSGEHSDSQQNQSIQEPVENQINTNLSNEQQPGLRRITTNLRLAVHTSYQFLSALIASIIPEQPPPLHLD